MKTEREVLEDRLRATGLSTASMMRLHELRNPTNTPRRHGTYFCWECVRTHWFESDIGKAHGPGEGFWER